MKRLLTITLFSLLFAILTLSPALAAEEASETTAPEKPLLASINETLFGVLFFDVAQGGLQLEQVDRAGQLVKDAEGTVKKKTVTIPFLIVFIAIGLFFYTFWYRFINMRACKHAIDVVRGKYDREDDVGEISHFRALTSALSATVGLGNIAGVAVAIQVGGPGAVFWMMSTAFFSMSAKFSSCTLAQMYRQTNADGSISGGPMYYLDIGLAEKGKSFALLGKVLGVMYAFLVMGGALGGGNMFQANQATAALVNSFGLQGQELVIGIVLSITVGIVILGGIKRIGAATSRLVPAMCGIYVVASLFVILSNASQIPSALGTIITMAFSQNAFFGGLWGVLVAGVTRAAFSNEGGLGSAAIAHAAAKTDEPVREGLVAMLGPVIDTMLVCLLTALVVIITGAWNDPTLLQSSAGLDSTLKGVTLTSAAFGSVLPWFPYVLTVCITLFAYSTLISWCYYGERGWIYLLDHFGGAGLKTVVVFRLIFVILCRHWCCE